MYENFAATDRWTGAPQHCQWRGTVVAIATRHADAVDVQFSVNHRTVTIALPNSTWVEHKRRTGTVITDRLAVQIAGRYLKLSIENGYDNGRDIYTMTEAEVFAHLDAVMREVGHTDNLPVLPVGIE
jgi:hypothetical protein